jgi:uncharacterized membrane protein YwaF
MMNVTQVFGNTLTASQTATVLSKFEKLYFIIFLLILCWFILTAIIMLIMAHKSSKKGQIMTIFVVSTLILMCLLLYGYFNLSSMITWFNL